MAGNTDSIHGKIARTAYGTAGSGTNIDFTDGWTVNSTVDLVDISRQGQHWKEVLPGQASWTATVSGQLVLGNTEQKACLDSLIAATPGVKLTGATALAFHMEDTGDYLSGDSYISSVQIGAQVADKVPVTFNVTGTGALGLTAG